METYQKTVGGQTYFVVADAAPALHDTLRGLYYSEFEGGFAKSFPADTPHLDRVYTTFERDMPELIRQAAGLQPVPWENCLLALLERLKEPALNWWLVGSAALAARGLAVTPHDLDLVVQDGGSSRLSELLFDCQVEPLQSSPGWIWGSFGRCFLHARLEWVGDVNETADSQGLADFGPTALGRSEIIQWRGCALRVPPLDLQLAVCERRGLSKRAALIRAALAAAANERCRRNSIPPPAPFRRE